MGIVLVLVGSSSIAGISPLATNTPTPTHHPHQDPTAFILMHQGQGPPWRAQRRGFGSPETGLEIADGFQEGGDGDVAFVEGGGAGGGGGGEEAG